MHIVFEMLYFLDVDKYIVLCKLTWNTQSVTESRDCPAAGVNSQQGARVVFVFH